MQSFDLCIIGAGWSGLLACKYALAHQLSVVVLEQRADLGGVWNFTEDPEVVTVMDSTVTSSSATVTEAADFPMPDSMGNFIHQADILSYLQSYAAHFGLKEYIRFEETVVTANKTPQGHWQTETQNSQYASRFLTVCAGPYQHKRTTLPAFQGFQGEILHLGEIKSITPDSYQADDHVLVYGGGESSSDIVELLTKTPARITWAIPNGQHFFRKANFFKRSAPGAYRKTDPALDEASSRFIQHVCAFEHRHHSKPGMRWLCTLGSTGNVLDYEGHGLPQWKKDVPFFHAMINKNGHVIEHIHTGRVAAQGAVDSCHSDNITFSDGTQHRFSHVILGTGYQYAFPYLSEPFAGKKLQERYKRIFDPDDPSLLFLGYARPNIGSVPMITELQCLYAFKVLSGAIALPDSESMRQEIIQDNTANDAYFCHKRKADSLIYPFIYGHDIAKRAGVKPNYRRLFLTRPLLFFKTFFAPYSPAHFLLNDKACQQQAGKIIWHRQHLKWFFWPWVYLVSRMLGIDAGLRFLAERRYQKHKPRCEALTRTEHRSR